MSNSKLNDTDHHRGGFLHGADRKVGTGQGIFPISSLRFELPKRHASPIALALYSSKVSAGFPSPAEDHVEKRLDSSEFLIDQQDATFFVTIQGQSMIDVGLMPGDKAVVDRSKKPAPCHIVLAVVNGEFTIKTLSRHRNGAPRLLPANQDFQPIDITEETQFEIWGVVTGSFRWFK